MKLLIAVTVLWVASTVAGADVVTYPAPASERQETPYRVWVNDQPLDLYVSRTLDPPFAGKQWDYGGPYWFANFDMSGPVKVKVTAQRSLRETVIRPVSKSVRPTVVDDRTLEFTLDQPLKLSLEPDGRRGPLLLFANPIETTRPASDDPQVVFFGPGLHKPEKITLGSNQTLYLAGGAVVKAEVLVQGENIRICGRGVLDGSDWQWRTGPFGNLIAIRDSRHVEVSGITLRGSSHWTIVPVHSQHVTVRNVKLCNSRVQNDDGINPCNSQDVLITDCFIRSDDDCVALKGLNFAGENNNVERITVENSTLWCDRARIFLLGHESRAKYMRDVTIRNLDIIHFTMTAFLLEPGEDMRLENVTIQNVRIYGEGQRSLARLKPVVNQYMRKKIPGFVRNVKFDNLRVFGQPGDYLIELEGADAEHNVRDVTFRDVMLGDQALNADSPHLKVRSHTRDVQFAESGDSER